MNETKIDDVNDEIEAMRTIFYALLPLSAAARVRILNWAVDKVNSVDRTPAPGIEEELES